MFLKAVSAISIGIGVLQALYGSATYFMTKSMMTEASAIQITQLATESTHTVVSGIAAILFGFAVGTIAVLREIRDAGSSDESS